MRKPDEKEDLEGKVCVCSIGRIGLVTGLVQNPDIGVHYWKGIGLDGKGPWGSSRPLIIAESAEEFRDRLEQMGMGRKE